MKQMDKGIVYVVTGNKKSFFSEAMLSIWSLRRFNTELPVQIFADKEYNTPRDFPNLTVKKIEKPTFSFIDKWLAIRKSPFKKTLYLDTDTFICRNPEDLLNHYLESFDMALCLDQSNYNKGYCSGGSGKDYLIPEFFPVFQGGVIGVKKNNKFNEFIKKYWYLFLEYGESNDQAALRVALYYDRSLQTLVLPPEWNMKLSGPVHFQIPPYILHGRFKKQQFLKLEKLMKKNFGIRRVYIPKFGVLSNPGTMLRSKLNGYFYINY